ncbi:MAG: SBBP repeat-containing protein [Promethearchaeota archaeon]
MKKKKNVIYFFIIIIISSLISISLQINFNNIAPNESANQIENQKPSTSLTVSWHNSWGDVNDDEDVQANDIYYKNGDFYNVGSTNKSGTDYDILLIKYNTTGGLVWSVTWDSGYDDFGEDVAVDQDSGDVYITGYFKNTTNDLVLIRYNSTGHYKWNITLDSGGYDKGNEVVVDSSSNIILTGIYGTKALIVKYNSTKHEQWFTTWFQSGDFSAYGYALCVDANNNIFVTGIRNGMVTSMLILIKYSQIGVQLWNYTYSASMIDDPYSRSIALDSNNYIYITGETSSVPYKLVLLKFEDLGSSVTNLWEKKWSYGTNADVYGEDIYIDSSDTLNIAVFLSKPNQSMICRRYTTQGSFSQEITYNKGNTNEKFARSVLFYKSNLYLSGIETTGPSGENDILVVKIPISIGGVTGDDDDDDDDDDEKEFGNTMLIIGITLAIIAGVVATIFILYKYKPTELKAFGKRARGIGEKTATTIRTKTSKGFYKMKEFGTDVSEKIKEKMKKDET